MAKKKRSVIEKVADAVDHVLHPDQPAVESAQPAVNPEKKKSSQADIDFQSHPKFHKFKGTAQGAY